MGESAVSFDLQEITEAIKAVSDLLTSAASAFSAVTALLVFRHSARTGNPPRPRRRVRRNVGEDGDG